MKTTIDSLEICQEENLLQSIIVGQKVEKETEKEVIKESQVESVYISSDIENVNMQDYASVMHSLIEKHMCISNNSDVIKKEDITSLLMDTNTKVMHYKKVSNNVYSQRCILQFIRSGNVNADNEINGYFINALLERLLKRIYYTERNKVYHSHIRNNKQINNKMLDCRIVKKDYGEFVYWNIDVSIMNMYYPYNSYVRSMDIQNKLCNQYKHMSNTIIEYKEDNTFDIVNIEQIDIVQYSNIDNDSNMIVVTI
ncbi:hypothetical protein PQE66_gp008 [Bacillus phage PBC2]|uniref:Uncharacterized protein n=1 Tax=Bacillus phage PBC2 TaxID=1675029 RepID=A0A218KBQ4_9CAUD|nr:hypothetical protein PQE66_gp008 [Bacillus phage PBC2]AKQ08323.1 hypothetical protein PBC2_008 [Bacillus phage PBC2]